MLSLYELTTAVEIGLIYGILAIGIYLTFRTINFPDLTCDGSFVTGAAISSVMIKSGCDPYTALFTAAFGGGLAGIFTGILNVCMKIDDLLSGIIVAFMLYSVNLRITGTSPNIALINEITVFSGGNSLLTICAVAAISVVFFSRLLNTDFGLGLRSTGQNRQFASAGGVNVNAMLIFGLAAGNAMVGMCGAAFTQYQGFCDVSQGVGSLVIGLASVIIGEKLLNRSNAFIACIVGSVVYRIFIAFAIHSDILGLKTQDLNLISGLLIIFIMRRKKSC
jgi:putative ABC transport system permease protein